ncbi:MAG TPA: hypothetical protein VK453_14830 [Micromonosporaceae bacterium]|nr:hypothetical protein [Micromonosporaceae bacterium]
MFANTSEMPTGPVQGPLEGCHFGTNPGSKEAQLGQVQTTVEFGGKVTPAVQQVNQFLILVRNQDAGVEREIRRRGGKPWVDGRS